MALLAQMGDGAGGMGGGIVMMVVMAVLALLLIAGVVWLVLRALTRGRGESAASDDPLRVLERRFARGEIDAEEYHERRSTLRGGG